MQFAPPRRVDVGGHSLAIDDVSPAHPEGTLLLLIGLSARRLGWFRQVPVLSQTHRVIAVDYRDIGESDPFKKPYALTDQADDMARLLDALEIEKTHVAGISMGGFVAQELALRHPQRVDRLVLVSTSAGGDSHVPPSDDMLNLLFKREVLEVGELARKNYAAFTHPGHFERFPEDYDTVAHIARQAPLRPDAYYRQLQAAAPHDASSRVQHIQAKTLVIHGLEDPLVPVINGQRLAQKIPGARLELYSPCGHIPIMEMPDQFNADVLGFLRDVV